MNTQIERPNLDLTKVKARVLKENPALTQTEVDQAAERYLDYWVAIRMNPTATLDVPDETVDLIWHAAILHTEQYIADTHAYFGKFLHHTPKDAHHCDGGGSSCKCAGCKNGAKCCSTGECNCKLQSHTQGGTCCTTGGCNCKLV